MMGGTIARKICSGTILLALCGVVAVATMSPAEESDVDTLEGSAIDDPWSLAPVVDVAAVKTESIDFGMDGMPTALQSGTVLMAVDVEPSNQGVLVHFHADGELALARTFVLNDPTRLVVDLPGIRGDLLSDHLVLGGDVVAGVRVGVHPGKLRVVIDGGIKAEAFRTYRAVPSEDGLYVMIGGDRELERKLEARVIGEEIFPSLAASEGLEKIQPEPVLIAMRSDGSGTSLVNPWDEVVETPDDAAILARVAESYAEGGSELDASRLEASPPEPGAEGPGVEAAALQGRGEAQEVARRPRARRSRRASPSSNWTRQGPMPAISGGWRSAPTRRTKRRPKWRRKGKSLSRRSRR